MSSARIAFIFAMVFFSNSRLQVQNSLFFFFLINSAPKSTTRTTHIASHASCYVSLWNAVHLLAVQPMLKLSVTNRCIWAVLFWLHLGAISALLLLWNTRYVVATKSRFQQFVMWDIGSISHGCCSSGSGRMPNVEFVLQTSKRRYFQVMQSRSAHHQSWAPFKSDAHYGKLEK